MKKILLFSIFTFLFILVKGQKAETQLKIIDKEIEMALAEKKYGYAAILEEEKDLQKKLETALQRRKYKKAAELQDKLVQFSTYRARRTKQLKQELKLAIEKGDAERQTRLKDEIFRLSSYQGSELAPSTSFFDDEERRTSFHAFAVFMVGKANLSSSDATSLYFRTGSNFYFDHISNYRAGIQVDWLGLGATINSDASRMQLTFLNIGFINMLAIAKNVDIELAGRGGFSLHSEFALGYSLGTDLKLKYKNWVFGLDYSHSKYSYAFGFETKKESIDRISLCVGLDFGW